MQLSNVQKRLVKNMKIIKSIICIVILLFTSSFAQPMLPPEQVSNNLPGGLKLNDGQKDKIEKILTRNKEQLDKLRDKMAVIMEDLKDSTEIITRQTEKDILKILNKEQAEKFKAGEERNGGFAFMPPPGMMGNGFPCNMPGTDNFQCDRRFGGPRQSGMPDGFQSGGGDSDENGIAPGQDLTDSNMPNDDDMDLLQDLDIFDLLSILE